MRSGLTNASVRNGCAVAILAIVGCAVPPTPIGQASSTAPSDATAQAIPAESAPAQTQEPAEPQPIPEGSVPARADLVAAALQRIERIVEPSERVAQIDEALDGRRVIIDALRENLDAIDARHVSPRRLDNARLAWLELQGQLDAWKQIVDSRFDALQAERVYLREARSQWEATQENAAEQDFAPELANRVDTVLASIIDAETRVRQQRNSVATVSDEIAASGQAVSDALQRIDGIRAEIRGRLLARDSPPLWRVFGSLQPRSLPDQALGAGRDWARAISSYLSLYPGRVLFLIITFPIMLALAYRLRRRARTGADDEGERAHRLIQRPASVALAATLVVMGILLPVPTGSAADLLFMLAVVPVMRLGPVVLEGRSRRLLRAVVALSVLAVLTSVGTGTPVGARLLLLVVAAIALIVALRAARWASRLETSALLARVATALPALYALLLLFALGANVFGWANLSLTLTHGTIFSAFGAFAWLVVVTSTRTLVPAFIGGGLGSRLPSLRRKRDAVVRVSVTVMSIIAVILWLRSTLVRFELRGVVGAALSRVAAGELSIGGLTISAGQLIGAAMILAATWMLARVVDFFVREEIVPRMPLRRGTDQSLATVLNYAVWGLGIALAASAAGLTGTQLAVVIGALGVGIGFGLQTIVNNFVSGLILVFERPIKVGDAIETPDYFGRVERIGIRASVIRSFDGAEIVVPNGELIAKAVTNWTGTDEIRRAEVQVGVAYGTDPEHVLEILRRVADEHPLVLDEPEVKAQMIRFGDSSLDFRLRCWTSMDDWIDVMSDLHVALNHAIDAAAITIPFPQRDLHIRSTAAGEQPGPAPAAPPANRVEGD